MSGDTYFVRFFIVIQFPVAGCAEKKRLTSNLNSRYIQIGLMWIKTLKPKQNCCHFTEFIFNCISWMKIYELCFRFHWNFDNNIPALVQIMAWHRPGNKPLSQPMTVSLLMHVSLGFNELRAPERNVQPKNDLLLTYYLKSMYCVFWFRFVPFCEMMLIYCGDCEAI